MPAVSRLSLGHHSTADAQSKAIQHDEYISISALAQAKPGLNQSILQRSTQALGGAA